MNKQKIYNMVGIISTIVLICSILGNFFEIDNKILNIALVFGMASKFYSLYGLSIFGHSNLEYESIKQILILEYSMIVTSVCIRLYNLI